MRRRSSWKSIAAKFFLRMPKAWVGIEVGFQVNQGGCERNPLCLDRQLLHEAYVRVSCKVPQVASEKTPSLRIRTLTCSEFKANGISTLEQPVTIAVKQSALIL